jgi:hypothetical protein
MTDPDTTAIEIMARAECVSLGLRWDDVLPEGQRHLLEKAQARLIAFRAAGWTLTPPPSEPQDLSFQARVQLWMQTCFGTEIAADKIERTHRFLEEALETVQANGCTRSEAHQLVDYVFDRPVGDLPQEIGGAQVTLAALCSASGHNMSECGEAELARIWTKVEQIRAKQAAKPKNSPLPIVMPPPSEATPEPQVGQVWEATGVEARIVTHVDDFVGYWCHSKPRSACALDTWRAWVRKTGARPREAGDD